MHLSIVIVNWNTRTHLDRALRSIYSAPPSFDIEVIVVDNASSDGSADMVAASYPSARLVRNTTNRGYAAANNQALVMASGARLLLLNPDVVAPPGALETADAVLEGHPDVAALGVRLRGPDGLIQQSVRGFPTPWSVLLEGLGLPRLFPSWRAVGAYRMRWFGYDREMDVDQPMGTFLLVRREALTDVGLLDEGFPIFFNEVDWCYRAKQRGWRVLFSPAAEIQHFGGASTRLVHRAMAWESRRGLLRFYAKHYGSARFLPVRLAAAGASWVQAALAARSRRAGDVAR